MKNFETLLSESKSPQHNILKKAFGDLQLDPQTGAFFFTDPVDKRKTPSDSVDVRECLRLAFQTDLFDEDPSEMTLFKIFVAMAFAQIYVKPDTTELELKENLMLPMPDTTARYLLWVAGDLVDSQRKGEDSWDPRSHEASVLWDLQMAIPELTKQIFANRIPMYNY